MPHYTGIVTLLAILLYFYTGLRVGGARARFGIKAPAVSGHPEFERIMRVQMNTLEWMPIFLPCLWLFAIYAGDRGAAAIGLVWIAGRIVYIVDYVAAAERRGRGFAIQFIAAAALFVGALAGIIWGLMTGA